MLIAWLLSTCKLLYGGDALSRTSFVFKEWAVLGEWRWKLDTIPQLIQVRMPSDLKWTCEQARQLEERGS